MSTEPTGKLLILEGDKSIPDRLLEISPLARNQFSNSSSWVRSIRATFCIGSRRLRMARWHQQSRKAPAQRGDLYVQKWPNASFSSHARAVANLLASRAFSFLRARPRTRLPLRNNGQRMFFRRLASSLLVACKRLLSARRSLKSQSSRRIHVILGGNTQMYNNLV